ncbi:hypothetical protein FGB62_37g412 [Gracilaria domingensis]|nr:hypothetical protein FGB62_37g412 [Gracilaria domingensis]
MMDAREEELVAKIGENVYLHSSGFLDIEYGAMLSAEAAISIMRLSEQSQRFRRQKTLAFAAEKTRHDLVDALRRSRWKKEPFVVTRTLKVRRAIAKSRVAAKRSLVTMEGVVGGSLLEAEK